MDQLFKTLQDWIEIPSVTGGEADYADALSRHLGDLGFAVERQQVTDKRFNVLARTGSPQVVFCTHLDTVPPWFGPKIDADFVHGRGSCDAKGPALAMISAAEALLKHGEDRLGFLFTVGEEVDSVGARKANELLAEPWNPRFTIIGEPTENRFVRSHKGIFKGHLCARGVAGHSSQPIGPSAIHELCMSVAGLLGEDWGRHPVFGEGTLNMGMIEGGVAPNVVADTARASLLLRAVEAPEIVSERIHKHLGEHVQLESLFHNYAPVDFFVPESDRERGEEISVAFGTDAPHMPRWGQPLLYGPGRILDAHTDHECVSRSSFAQAVQDLIRVAGELLERPA